jgi:hypothetical protein
VHRKLCTGGKLNEACNFGAALAGLDSREDDRLTEIELIYSILDDINQARPAFGRPAVCIIQVERSVIVCETETFSVDESWLSRRPSATEPKVQFDFSEKLAAQEKEMIEAALRETKGRVFGPSGAAAKLGMPGTTLDSKIKSLKISKNRFKTA